MNLFLHLIVLFTILPASIFAREWIQGAILVQWDAKLNCNIHQRYCFWLELNGIVENHRPKPAPRSTGSHPHICTERPKTGISKQMYYDLEVSGDDMFRANYGIITKASIVHNCTSDQSYRKLTLNLPKAETKNGVDTPYADLQPKIMSNEFKADLTDHGKNCNGPDDSSCTWAPEWFAKDGHFYDNTDLLKDVQHFLN